jgi:hypothetical protein
MHHVAGGPMPANKGGERAGRPSIQLSGWQIRAFCLSENPH